MRTWLAAADILGAIIGAGFASGREIAAFFARFGCWGVAGIVVACICARFILWGAVQPGRVGGMPAHWQNTVMESIWRGMFVLLLTATGGAMLAAAGEVVQLLLPMHHAALAGMAVTLWIAQVLSRRTGQGMAALSQGLVICLGGMIFAGLVLPRRQGVVLQQDNSMLKALAYGAAYGGFNAALAAPAASVRAEAMPMPARRRCVWFVAAVMGMLLLCAHMVLARHPALQGEPLPFVVMLSALGKGGYYLCAGAMYLAVLTTLCASLRGLKSLLPGRKALPALLVALAALLGFEQVVGAAYPLLGGGCMLLLVCAHLARAKT